MSLSQVYPEVLPKLKSGARARLLLIDNVDSRALTGDRRRPVSVPTRVRDVLHANLFASSSAELPRSEVIAGSTASATVDDDDDDATSAWSSLPVSRAAIPPHAYRLTRPHSCLHLVGDVYRSMAREWATSNVLTLVCRLRLSSLLAAEISWHVTLRSWWRSVS